MSFAEEPTAHATPGPASKLARIVLALLLGVVLLEVGLRLAGAAYLGGDGARGVAATELELEPVPGLTLACLGDSNTYGVHEPAEDAYPARLEQLLNERVPGGPHRVLNLGIPGLTPEQVRTELEALLAHVELDAVLVVVGVNASWSRTGADASPWYESLRVTRLARLLVERGLGGADGAVRGTEDVAGEWALVDLPDRRGLSGEETLEEASGLDREGRPYRYRTVARPAAEDGIAERVRSGVAAIVQLAREHDVPLLLSTYAADSGFYGYANEGLRAAASATGAPLVDAGRSFPELVPRFGRDRLFLPDGHPRRLGYELFARLAYDGLVDAGAVEGARLEDWTADLHSFVEGPPPLRFYGSLADFERGDDLGLELFDEEPGYAFQLLISGDGPPGPVGFGPLTLPLASDAIFAAGLGLESLRGEVGADGTARCSLRGLLAGGRPELLAGKTLRAVYVVWADAERQLVRRYSPPSELQFPAYQE